MDHATHGSLEKSWPVRNLWDVTFTIDKNWEDESSVDIFFKKRSSVEIDFYLIGKECVDVMYFMMNVVEILTKTTIIKIRRKLTRTSTVYPFERKYMWNFTRWKKVIYFEGQRTTHVVRRTWSYVSVCYVVDTGDCIDVTSSWSCEELGPSIVNNVLRVSLFFFLLCAVWVSLSFAKSFK